MNIRNLLNYSDENAVTFLPTEDEIVAHICPSEEEQGQGVGVYENDDSREQAPIGLREATYYLDILYLSILQLAGDQSKHLAMVRKLQIAVAKLKIEIQVQPALHICIPARSLLFILIISC